MLRSFLSQPFWSIFTSLMRILYAAEIVGKAGVFTMKNLLPSLKEEFKPDFIFGCADGVTGGFGLGKNHAFYLHKLGLRALTLGECSYYKKDLPPLLPTSGFLLRPANLPSSAPGKGWRIFETPSGKVAVVSLLGQSGYSKLHSSSPFHTLDSIIEKVRAETPRIVVDFHACTTAEKNTLFHYAAGRVSAVIGSHTKVPTADARVLPAGTAVITDAGRTGSQTSVAGFLPDKEIQRYLTGIPQRSEETWADLAFQGVFVELDSGGKAVKVQNIQRICKEVPHDQTGHGDQD